MELIYKFSDTDIKKILKENISILVDTREQVNDHIIEYLDKNNIEHKPKKFDSGDYGVMLRASPSHGIVRDIHLNMAIERKRNIDELCNNFGDGRTAFENEFIRAQKNNTRMILLIEDGCFYDNLAKNNYRSSYKAKSLIASLKAFEARYNFNTIFIDKKFSGTYIYSTLYYYLREVLQTWSLTKSGDTLQ